MQYLNPPEPTQNLVKLWKPKGVCRCENELWWKEYQMYFAQVNPKREHGVDYVLKCQICDVELGRQTIIFHFGKSDLCDSCNYWAYGFSAPLDFAQFYLDSLNDEPEVRPRREVKVS